jgi:hypothetical protein
VVNVLTVDIVIKAEPLRKDCKNHIQKIYYCDKRPELFVWLICLKNEMVCESDPDRRHKRIEKEEKEIPDAIERFKNRARIAVHTRDRINGKHNNV